MVIPGLAEGRREDMGRGLLGQLSELAVNQDDSPIENPIRPQTDFPLLSRGTRSIVKRFANCASLAAWLTLCHPQSARKFFATILISTSPSLGFPLKN